LFFYELDIITILVISLFFFVIILVLKFDNYPIVYIALAIIFYLVSRNNDIFSVVSSLIFLYGLPIGTLIAYKMKNKKNDIFKFLLKKYSLFVIITLLLYLIF